ncbi:hypothetical protein GCM10007094_41230 [Pseudovibrio japonicus]|uniref:Uncharacterized protein n=1 Tax=Pseudovibrio japonicus TaxID=366534 RepID=A0ABQ3ERX3_9HYPH|nr:hypothetical protein [Pseudovibrio japonicus]GHB47698.1 hypothetical protein GCM10007094_41230 [Pseudovibrio japonicus]
MRTIYFILLLTAVAEFRAEVHGKGTLTGASFVGLKELMTDGADRPTKEHLAP